MCISWFYTAAKFTNINKYGHSRHSILELSINSDLIGIRANEWLNKLFSCYLNWNKFVCFFEINNGLQWNTPMLLTGQIYQMQVWAPGLEKFGSWATDLQLYQMLIFRSVVEIILIWSLQQIHLFFHSLLQNNFLDNMQPLNPNMALKD